MKRFMWIGLPFSTISAFLLREQLSDCAVRVRHAKSRGTKERVWEEFIKFESAWF